MIVDGWLHDKIATCRLKKTGRNPTDRGKQGVKRSLMADANGLPLSLVVAGANTHDIKLVEDTLDGLQTGRPGQRLRLCLDKGYAVEWLETCLKARRYEPCRFIPARALYVGASRSTGQMCCAIRCSQKCRQSTFCIRYRLPE
jgi:hypothetical protein